MKIVDKRGEVNLNQWMNMVKGRNGLNWWGHMSVKNQCAHSLNILPYMNNCSCVTHHVDGSGIKFGAMFENLWEANACVLIVCSFCNVSQSPAVYRHKWACVSWLLFSPPSGKSDKH
jgi:hypothetical protein